MEAVLGGGGDPGLVLAIEGDAPVPSSGGFAGVVADQVAAGPEADAGGADPG